MSLSGQVILLEAEDGSSEVLAQRIEQLGPEVTLVRSLGEAQTLITERRIAMTALLIPTNLPAEMSAKSLKKEIQGLRRTHPDNSLVLMSTGKAPARDERKKLRSAGLQLALWEPFDDGTLRFQVNRAVSGDTNEHGRRRPRVPTYLFARVYVGDRTKDTIIYSLSEGGAFLETPRASMPGAAFDVEIRLPGQPIMARAEVVFSNVVGNLQRPNLPMGMGVRFDGLSKDEVKALRTYVKARLDALLV